eukprot:TRINITY_DN4013_c0_g1_i10.p1 TRINITY_DN4013_c0_g1~~TRINITY_DN4013_c0_g1_i10.p1  ORF type:complete len:470 (+),score=63.70 TRINITY_DN4013_c0_g1_i10:43-1452(+)
MNSFWRSVKMDRFKWMTKELPGFGVNGSQIRVISQPADFYQELLTRSGSSSKRIVMASLYLGTGSKENSLVQRIQTSLVDKPSLRGNFLLDWCRGTRVTGGVSSASTLAPLLDKFQTRFRVFMYHTPHLRGLYKKYLPARWNETIGLQHCKIYIFDDSLIISGANLSNDYFTNRQDRYVLIENCEKLADFYDNLVTRISQFSLEMDKAQEFSIDNSKLKSHPFEGDLKEFKQESSDIIQQFISEEKEKNKLEENEMSKYDTWIFPTIQMGPLDIVQDSEATVQILRSGEKSGRFTFGSGYFNLTQDYLDEILHKSESEFDLLMAHPNANGFLGARGFAGGIPHAYTHIARKFYNKIDKLGLHDRIRMHEYQREGWTFHAKGLWYYPPDSKLPTMTMVGSPNFGYRSVDKDLETQITIVTRCPELQEQLHQEQKNLLDNCNTVNHQEFDKEERKVPLWVKMFVKGARHYF